MDIGKPVSNSTFNSITDHLVISLQNLSYKSTNGSMINSLWVWVRESMDNSLNKKGWL